MFTRINKSSAEANLGRATSYYILRIANMEKQEYKSKWDELAKEIGAEVSPEILQREQAVSSVSESPAAGSQSREVTSRPSTTLPKKSAVNWDDLAGELGLPPAPPEEKPVEPVAEQTSPARETVMHSEPREPESRPASPHRERPRREDSQSRRPARPPREPRGEKRERRERSGQRRDHRGEQRLPHRSADADFESERDEFPRRKEAPFREEEQAERSSQPPEAVPEEPTKPAAVSLWHKIFGSPAEQTTRFVQETEPAETTEASDLRDEPRDAGGFADSHSEETIFDEGEDEFDRESSSSATDESAPAERRRGRSRRRRGRGRGNRSESQPEESRSSRQRDRRERTPDHADDDDEFDESDFDGDLGVDDESIGARSESDQGEDGAEIAVGSGGPRKRAALQRAIPSWEDAIGFIVDSNMQNRSQRRPPSRSGSRDNGGRGRSRGRRKPQ